MSQVINMDVVEELLDLCQDGDPELLVDLIRMFLEDGPIKVRAITTGVQAKDHTRIERAAHALKGSAGNLGVIAVQMDCDAIQTALRDGREADVCNAAHQLQQHFTEAELALQNLLTRYS